MPKTTVNEDCHFCRPKNNIRSSVSVLLTGLTSIRYRKPFLCSSKRRAFSGAVSLGFAARIRFKAASDEGIGLLILPFAFSLNFLIIGKSKVYFTDNNVLTLAFIFVYTVVSLSFATSVNKAVCARASLIGLYSLASLDNPASCARSFTLSTKFARPSIDK